ncbi:MAG TPA: hypothetical protein PKE03_07005 [Bacteroidales bacterium]|nr:hypothetical protein [Bacteroidales bacterium]
MKKLAIVLSIAAFVAFALPVNQVVASVNTVEMVRQDNEKKKEEPKKSEGTAKKECCSKKTECKEEKK